MARWVQALLLVVLLVQAQVATGSKCECRAGEACGNADCPVCAMRTETTPREQADCCHAERSAPRPATDDRHPCDCGRCAQAHPVAYLGRSASLGDGLAHSAGPLLPGLDLAVAAPGLTAADARLALRIPASHGPPRCPSGASPDLLPVLRL